MKKILLILSLLICQVAEARPIRFVTKIGAPVNYNVRSTPNLRVWFDGKDASTISIATGVSQWSDKSGNAFHATQASAGLQPSYTAGSGVDFSSNVSSYLNINPAAMPPGNHELFAVATRADLNFYRCLVGGGGADNSNLCLEVSSNEIMAMEYLGSNYSSLLWNSGSKNRAGYYLLGRSIYHSLDGSPHSFTYEFSDGFNTQVDYIGGHPIFPDAGFGIIHEIIVVSGTASASTRTKIGDYFKKRWGVV